jgi:hypothetical protein
MLGKSSPTELYLQSFYNFYFEIGPPYVTHAALEIMILLPQPPE